MAARWLREPLLHFAVCGALLFAAHAWLNPPLPGSDRREVRIGAGEVRWLAATWRGQAGRDPTQGEMRELVANLVKEELLSREAREMRLDENDTIVRRRLAQKLEFVLQDTARLAEPTEAELRRFYEASPMAFLTEPRISFAQVYFKDDRRAAAALPKVAASSPADAANLGDRLMVEPEFRAADPQAIAATFGPQFARAVSQLSPGSWHGPVESGYGAHLVRVAAVEPARRREFAEVRSQVLERWREEKQRETQKAFMDKLAAKYSVVIECGGC